MSDEKKCPKCDSDMELGYTTESFSVRVVAHVVVPCKWLPGKPNLDQHGAVNQKKTDFSKAVPISMFRCSKCGFLESYATPE